MDARLELDQNGFVILPSLLATTDCRAAQDYADQLLNQVPWSDNDFDGRRTRRVYSLLGRLGALEPLLTHPDVHELVSARLGDVYQFGMIFLSAVDPDQGSQPVHFDAGVYPLKRSVEAETNVIWALDDFTASNGATCAVPGSHRWDASRRPEVSEFVPVEMGAGSALVYSGNLWHRAGTNSSHRPRRTLICEHVLPWLRPTDNNLLTMSFDQLIRLSPELRRLAGLTPASTYLGLIGGSHPDDWLRAPTELRTPGPADGPDSQRAPRQGTSSSRS